MSPKNNNEHCRACKLDIEPNASVCPNCGSAQSRFRSMLKAAIGPVSLAISTIALMVSISAYLSSIRPPEINPSIELQVTGYEEEAVKFFAFNAGNAPTSVQGGAILISFQQRDTLHSVRTEFNLAEPLVLMPGEAEEIAIEYERYIPRWTEWNVAGTNLEELDLSFLYAASGMGNNLHCEIRLYFTQSGYYDFRASNGVQTNGNCGYAMEWFAKELGHLSTEPKNP